MCRHDFVFGYTSLISRMSYSPMELKMTNNSEIYVYRDFNESTHRNKDGMHQTSIFFFFVLIIVVDTFFHANDCPMYPYTPLLPSPSPSPPSSPYASSDNLVHQNEEKQCNVLALAFIHALGHGANEKRPRDVITTTPPTTKNNCII